MTHVCTVEGWIALMESFPSDGWDGAAIAIAAHDRQVREYERDLDVAVPGWRERELPFMPRSSHA